MSNLCFLFDACWFHLLPGSAQPKTSPAPGAQQEQLQTGLPWDWIQIPTAPHSAFVTSLRTQLFILAHADWRSGTSLVSDATTALASITIKHNHNNKINLLSYRFWSYDIEFTLHHIFVQENSSDLPSYVFDRSSLLKSKLVWWWMD